MVRAAVLLLLPIPCLLTLAADPDLKPGQAQDCLLGPSQAKSFTFTLDSGDFARLTVNSRGQALRVRTFTPAGQPFRGAEFGPEGGRLDLVAEASGKYRAAVSAADTRESARFSLTLAEVVPLETRLAPPQSVESTRMTALRKAVESGHAESVTTFWNEVARTGAPLIEPLKGEHDNMAVTFLWRGTPFTGNVLVLWLPYAGAAPDDFLMTRLGSTDVWYRTIRVDRRMRMSYSLAPNAAGLRPISLGVDQHAIDMIAAAARTDPLNPRRWREEPRSLDPPEYSGRSVLEMPDAPKQPWAEPHAGTPTGRVERHTYASAVLKNKREVAVYLPPGYSPRADPYPLLVVFDKHFYLGDADQPALVPTPTILDNLIAAARIPPLVALLIGNAPGARDRELACNAEFTRVLATELVPWARGLYNFTRDPHRTVVAGSSFGGLASACAGLRQPETFGNVLAQSGSFHWTPPDDTGAPGSAVEPNWVARQFIASPKESLRFYLDAGSAEFNATGGSDSILTSTRTLRDVLRAKGYEVHFQEFAGGHDYLGWRGTLADGLIALLGSAGPKPE